MEKLKKDIVNCLIENGKYTEAELVSMTGEPQVKVATALRELEASGAILKYSAVVDWDKVEGENVGAIITVRVKPQKLKGFDALAEELCAFKEVQSLYLISGGFDLAVVVRAKSLGEVARFVSESLSAVDGVISCDTHFILKKYKVEGQSTIEKRDNERLIVL